MSKMYITKEQLKETFMDRKRNFTGPFTYLYIFLILLICFIPVFAIILLISFLAICYIPFYVLDEYVIRRLLNAKN